MSKLIIPKGYKTALDIYETQTAIGLLKRNFEDNLSRSLNLKRVSAPLFVDPSTGLNDDLNGIERAVEFSMAGSGKKAQIVHSLAKWKRMALHKYKFPVGEGIYTDMNAIRRDEELDNLHSVYVDQWDWEKVICKESRSEAFLKDTVKKIVGAICSTNTYMKAKFPALSAEIKQEVEFATTQQLEDLYPSLAPEQRENEFLKEHKAAFIMKIGGALKSGEKHGGRAPDYDDWELNGDILFWSDILECAVEISSMGVRVDSAALDRQLSESGFDGRRNLPFHKMLLEGKLPLTIGGGIGQSRLCLLLLQKAHIGEVQVSLWDNSMVSGLEQNGVKLL